jgi:hypothetical protein
MNASTEEPRIRPYEPTRDEDWATEVLGGGLAGRHQARRGELVDVLDGWGLVAELDRPRPVGLLTFRSDGPSTLELAALLVVEPGNRIG